MAAPALPDLDELALRHVRLRRRETEVGRRLVKAHDRHATFPSELTRRRVDELEQDLAGLRRELESIRARLLPIMRRPG